MGEITLNIEAIPWAFRAEKAEAELAKAQARIKKLTKAADMIAQDIPSVYEDLIEGGWINVDLDGDAAGNECKKLLSESASLRAERDALKARVEEMEAVMRKAIPFLKDAPGGYGLRLDFAAVLRAREAFEKAQNKKEKP
jgi:hypothetical protein